MDLSIKAFLAHSGFVRPDLLIAAWIFSASFAAILTANNTVFAVPFGSFGLPILFFILLVNFLFDTNIHFS
jgi:hypothetical protein